MCIYSSYYIIEYWREKVKNPTQYISLIYVMASLRKEWSTQMTLDKPCIKESLI